MGCVLLACLPSLWSKDDGITFATDSLIIWSEVDWIIRNADTILICDWRADCMVTYLPGMKVVKFCLVSC